VVVVKTGSGRLPKSGSSARTDLGRSLLELCYRPLVLFEPVPITGLSLPLKRYWFLVLLMYRTHGSGYAKVQRLSGPLTKSPGAFDRGPASATPYRRFSARPYLPQVTGAGCARAYAERKHCFWLLPHPPTRQKAFPPPHSPPLGAARVLASKQNKSHHRTCFRHSIKLHHEIAKREREREREETKKAVGSGSRWAQEARLRKLSGAKMNFAKTGHFFRVGEL